MQTLCTLLCERALSFLMVDPLWSSMQVGSMLGRGGFGTTYLVTKKGTDEKYACKASVWDSGGK
jgi:hypothetical protein